MKQRNDDSGSIQAMEAQRLAYGTNFWASRISTEKSLNALRQLMDMLAREELPGLYLVITGTRDFFEGYKGLKGLAPLYQRVHTSFGDDPTLDNLRATQVRLLPFTQDRLLTVGRRVRDLYPAKHVSRIAARVDDQFLGALVTQITSGFGGKVGLAPRLFLRELIDVLDRVDLHERYDPTVSYRLDLDDSKLTSEELAAKHGRAPEAEEELEQPAEPAPPAKTRRLDG